MKQSTKLLSLLLALIMAFSCMSVIGNAALVESEVSYDNIDDADLTPEQVADLALDLVDNDLLADMETIDLSILGELRLNSIDNILTDICKLRASAAWTIGSGLIGDIGDLDFSPLKKSGSWGTLGIGASQVPWQRADDDLNVIKQLIDFIGKEANAKIISKIACGIGTNDGISLGLIGSFLSLGEMEDMLANIPLYLTSMVFDMLLYGSFNYAKDTEDLGGMANLPTEADTLDEIAKQALLQLLLDPQDYTWDGEGESATKVWDDNSKITTLEDFDVTTRDELWNKINPMALSLFQILDNIAQPAIDKFGVVALNNNLKKALMEACEVEFNEIDLAQIKDDGVKATFANESAYVSYIAYDCIAKASNGVWYYTTLKTEVLEDADGNPILDEEGNEQTVRERKYYRANFAAANEFATLINWDWKFVESDSTDEGTKLLYTDLISNGSIVSGINWLLEKVYDTALTEETQADYEAVTGGFVTGGNEVLTENITLLAKYVLGNFGEKIWGKDSPYADYTYADYNAMNEGDLVDIIAILGPSFFEDAMPQIILPKNADGTYAFHNGVQLWEFAAVVLRELITGIAPNINYDAVIFANGDVTSANDRLFEEQDADTWFNILLNMGMDLAYTYLNNITNFNRNGDHNEVRTPVTDVDTLTEERWKGMLDEVIMWCVSYVGSGDSGILAGINPTTVEAIDGPLNKLDYILNTLLPLGLVGEAYAPGGELDLDLVLEGAKALITDLDLTKVLDLLGRNATGFNILSSTNLVNAVLTLVNEILALVFDTTILQGVGGRESTATQSIDAVVTQANLKTTVKALLMALNTNSNRILTTALPVLGKLVSGWGTEQEFNTPTIGLADYYDLKDGVASEKVLNSSGEEVTNSYITVKIRNRAEGVWRHYIDPSTNTATKDKQYTVIPTSVAAYNYDNTASSYMTVSGLTKDAINYGGTGSFTFTTASVPATGALVRVDVKYKVTDELGNEMLNGKEFTTTEWTYLNYNKTDAGTGQLAGSSSYETYVYSPHYVGMSDIKASVENVRTASFWRENVFLGSAQTNAVNVQDEATKSGITFGNASVKPKNKNYNRIDVFNFKTQDYSWKDEDDENEVTFSTAGSVDAAAFAASGKKSGEYDTWSVQAVTKNQTETYELKLVYIDDIYKNKLVDLVYAELNKKPIKEYYNTTGTYYANEVLTAVDETVDGETVLRQTNYSTTATVDGVEVTAIDAAKAWAEYYEALEAGARIGLQAFNGNKTEWDFKSAYERLQVAANDANYIRKTSAELQATEGLDVDDAKGAIAALEAQLKTSQATRTDLYNYTDYKMYRLNRYNEAREDVQWYLNLLDDASPATVDEIDEYFDYNWMEENDYRALVANADNGFDATTKANLLALLKSLDEEEKVAKDEWLQDKKNHLASIQLIDVQMDSTLLDLTEDRLLKREGAGTYKDHINDEIASAEAMITDESAYTVTSWANYSEALAAAKVAATTDSQKQMFDAKYELLVQRNRLVKVGEEADYNELNALIEQAKFALANQDMYQNGNYDFGRVLAELGFEDGTVIKDGNGYEFNLFPGSAYEVLARGYDEDDQNKVDRAATALKEALARLKFKEVAVSGTGATVEDVTLVEADEEKDIEEVVAKVATINANLDEAAVKKLFNVTATGATVGEDNITVSTDINYAVEFATKEDFVGFAGTNATVTFYTVQNGVKIPVATVKLVVKGDINGDGTVDVLDASYGALVAQEKTELSGCYLLAGDLEGGDKAVTTADYSAIVNIAIA